ncbi:MAG: hypothetical protein IJ719_13255 [Clostridia bacterium]|nr:hypothetical protein [Clostridia bacterium]
MQIGMMNNFQRFSARKKLIHETPEGMVEVSKELKLIVDEEVKNVNEQAEQKRINDMRNIQAATGWTAQQTMDAWQIPMEQRVKPLA